MFQNFCNQLGTEISSFFCFFLIYEIPISVRFNSDEFAEINLITFAKVFFYEFKHFPLNISFFYVFQFSDCDFLVQIKILNVLSPVVDWDSVHLIGLKHHEVIFSKFYYHSYMVEFAVCYESLELSASIFGVKEQDVSGFSCLNELLFGDCIFWIINWF